MQQKRRWSGGMGDLLSKLRKRGSQAQPAESDASASAPAAQGPAAKALATPASVPATVPGTSAAAASGHQPPVRTEWDLDNEADCIDWALQCFSSEKRDGMKVLAEFFASWLRSKASKSEKLSEVFYKNMIGPQLLTTSNWAAVQRYNRGLRFVSHPSAVWEKNSPRQI
ncbi:unnamed protein product [Effrenium voratum]|nr:unnamed protein product [Effrenium voratum]